MHRDGGSDLLSWIAARFRERSDRVARELQLDTAPEASFVYDRHENIVFSFAMEDRTNIPAARGYFAKSAFDLNTVESALLAGIIPCPSVCSPRRSPNERGGIPC